MTFFSPRFKKVGVSSDFRSVNFHLMEKQHCQMSSQQPSIPILVSAADLIICRGRTSCLFRCLKKKMFSSENHFERSNYMWLNSIGKRYRDIPFCAVLLLTWVGCIDVRWADLHTGCRGGERRDRRLISWVESREDQPVCNDFPRS